MADLDPRTRPRDSSANGARRTIRTYEHYADAEAVVDRLSDRGFPVENVSIVARGLRFVESVTGRTTTLTAGGRGAGGGALMGAVLGWLFGLFNWADPVVSALALAAYGLLLGAVIGAAIAAIGHALMGGRRDFSSVAGLAADAYDVMVDAEFADEAERTLADTGSSGQAATVHDDPERREDRDKPGGDKLLVKPEDAVREARERRAESPERESTTETDRVRESGFGV